MFVIRYANEEHQISSYEDASIKWRKYIRINGLGSRDIMEDPKIYYYHSNTKAYHLVAHVSYNGKVWSGDRYISGQHPLFSPSKEGIAA